MQLRVLGPVDVVDGPRTVPLTPKERKLLAVLALHRGRVVAGDELIEALWGDALPQRPDKTLQNHVLRLRKALHTRDDAGSDLRIETRAPGYVLELAAGASDVGAMEQTLAAARAAAARGDLAGNVLLLEEAASWWRGRSYGDFADEPFAVAEAARLDELRLVIVEERITAALALGRHALCVPELEALVALHPLRERLWGQLMLALYRDGRAAEALRAFRRARWHLVEELGVEPGHELTDLERANLDRDALLDVSLSSLEPVASAAPGAAPAVPEPLTRDRGRLVGRAADVERLFEAWKRVLAGRSPAVAAVLGPAGIGKTRLGDCTRWLTSWPTPARSCSTAGATMTPTSPTSPSPPPCGRT